MRDWASVTDVLEGGYHTTTKTHRNFATQWQRLTGLSQQQANGVNDNRPRQEAGDRQIPSMALHGSLTTTSRTVVSPAAPWSLCCHDCKETCELRALTRASPGETLRILLLASFQSLYLG